MTLFYVGDQSRPLRPPPQPGLGQRARRRVVGRHEGGEETEVPACFLGGDADGRQLQLPADGLGDVSKTCFAPGDTF